MIRATFFESLCLGLLLMVYVILLDFNDKLKLF